MKRLILLLMVLGTVFAISFPQEIYGTDLELGEYTGDLSNGGAYYYNADQTIIIEIGTSSMSSSDWNSIQSDYESSGATKTTEPGMTCWYVCDYAYDDYGLFYYCLMDCHYSETFLMIDSYVDGNIASSEYDALYENLVVAQAMKNAIDGTTGGNGDGEADNGENGEFDLEEICPCSTALGLIGLAFTGLMVIRRN